MFQSIVPIAEAIATGWSSKSILKQLTKKFPKLSPFVSKAETAGFLAPTILRALAGKNSDINTHESDISERRKQTKKNIGLGALGLAGLGAASLAGRGIGASAQAAAAVQNPIIPPPPGSGGGGAGNTPPGPAQGQGGLLSPVPGGPIPTQPSNPTQAGSGGIYTQGLNTNSTPDPNQQANQARHEKFDPIAENLPTKTEQNYPHLPNFVKRMQESGKEAEEIYDLAKQSPLLGPLVQKVEAETGQPYLERIKRSGQQKTTSESKMSTPAPLKSEVVMTPTGAGQVHKTHGKDAYVEVDNKLKKVPLDELEKPTEDVVKAVSDILKIPEIDRSSNISLFVYDPDDARAYFQFHDGSFYRYTDMDPKVVEDIAAKNATPITSGENAYGAWSPDDPHGSLGAALWAYVLKDPKYAKSKKGQPANPNYKKLQTLYDYWEKLRKKKK